jgi:nitrilase
MTKLAVVQKTPAFLDKAKCIESAVDSIAEAVSSNADIVIFTETFIPGYPSWIWRLRPRGDWNLSEELYKRLLNNAVNIDSEDLNIPLEFSSKKY